jgi:hypothetical protein
MSMGRSRSIRTASRYVLASVLFLTVLALFVPMAPLMPAPRLDTSWMMAMNQGFAQGFVFGKDIVFTFGPYTSIYTEMYHPATDRLMVFGSLFLGICYALLLLLLAKGKKAYGLLLYSIFLACLVDSRDALLFSYPLILALAVYRITLPEDHKLQLRFTHSTENRIALLFAPLGLLPLIKESLLPICGIIALLCLAILWLRKKAFLASMAAAVPAISCVFFWRIAGQPILALPNFFLSSRQLISGYTEAMSFPGDVAEAIFYALASAVILVAIAWTARGPKRTTWFLCISYAFFLFIAFKAGFVRHDPWHNIIAGTSILAAGLLLMFVLGEKASLLPLTIAVLVWAYIGHGTVQTTSEDISANLRGKFARSFQGVQTRFSQRDALQKQYDEHIAAIRSAFPIPRLEGTADIYSFNQSWLLASGNAWTPRPVTQSYAAFTPELAELNLRHLQGPGAPENILFRVEPIDGRLPSLEDGLSWPALIDGYSFQKLEGDTEYLRKRPGGIAGGAMTKDPFYAAAHEFGEEVTLPDSTGPLFARMEIRPTLLGRLFSAVYKPPELHIAVRVRDGKTIDYRVVSKMLETDFLITPLVRSTEEFVLLGAGGGKYLTKNKVRSITISSNDHRGIFWKTSYSLELRQSNLLKNSNAENALLFERIEDTPPAGLSAASTQSCEGSIEAVNGIAPHFGIPAIGNALSVKGWLAISGKDGIVPDAVFVALTTESGKTIYVRTHSALRNDIRGHFNQPTMPDPGFAAIMDVSSLNGSYTLGLARSYKGISAICQQWKLPIVIAH